MPYRDAKKQRLNDVVRQKRRRLKNKLRAVALLGGKCLKCGYNRYFGALQFHHRDRATKSFDIGASLGTRAWSKIEEELKKCDLLCANCHAEVEAEPGGIYAVEICNQ